MNIEIDIRDYLKKYQTQPLHVKAVQFDNSPKCLEALNIIANGKLEVDNTSPDYPKLSIELGHVPLIVMLGDWIILKDPATGKWSTESDQRFKQLYEENHWKKLSDNIPPYGNQRVFGIVNKGTEHEKKTQFYAFWDGDYFLDANMREDREYDVIYFYDTSHIQDPE